MKATIVAITAPRIRGDNDVLLTPEQFVVYCARVSSPQNQLNTETAPRLLAYCIRNRHWSIFEQVDMTVEIETSRAIAAQILRHRSFSFQEFSQRYARATESEPVELRIKGSSNRQGSLEEVASQRVHQIAAMAIERAWAVYDALLADNVAPECARMVLPLCTRTRLYMKGSIRSWIHYFSVRCDGHAQKEHRLLAEEIRRLFNMEFPAISAAIDEDSHA